MGRTYIAVGLCTRHAVELIPRQVCIVAAVDEIVGQWVVEINWRYRGRGAGCWRAHVFEEFVLMRGFCELIALFRRKLTLARGKRLEVAEDEWGEVLKGVWLRR